MSISRNEDILTFEVLHLASKVYFITNTAMLEPGSISEKKPQKNTKVANDLVYEILNKKFQKNRSDLWLPNAGGSRGE